MTDETTANFIRHYSPSDRDRIVFAWNGKHSAEFADSNQPFRRSVIQAILDEPGQAAIDLLQDLFEAEARWSCEAWCISPDFPRIACLMLTRGVTDSLDTFLRWCHASFDTICACHAMRLDKLTARSLLHEIERRIAATTDEVETLNLKAAKDLFEKLLAGNAAKGLHFIDSRTPISKVRVVSRLEMFLHGVISFFRWRR